MFLTLGRDATAQPAIRPYGSLYKFHLSVSLQCYFFFFFFVCSCRKFWHACLGNNATSPIKYIANPRREEPSSPYGYYLVNVLFVFFILHYSDGRVGSLATSPGLKLTLKSFADKIPQPTQGSTQSYFLFFCLRI